MRQKLEELIDKAPPGHFDPKVKGKLPQVKQGLRKVADLMDGIGRYDAKSQKTYIDENSLRKLIREATPGSENAVIERLKSIPGNNLTKDTGGMSQITFDDLARRMAPAGELSLPTPHWRKYAQQ